MNKYLLLIILPCICGALRAADPPKHAHRHDGDGIVSLDVWAEGNRVHLLTATLQSGKPAALQYQRSDNCGESFLAPIAVGISQPAPDPIHRGMDAQIAAHGDRLIAVWTTAGKEDRFGRGPLATAISADGGKSWKAGPNPSDFLQSIGHAFIDIAADQNGTFHLVWIDGRDRSGTGATPAGKGLRYARSTDGGLTWSANRTLDAATCECCWNSIAIGPAGRIAVLYRDRDPRDMAIARSNDGGQTWEPPATVGTFDWNVNVCPHVGGGLTFLPSNPNVMFATVWSGKAGSFGAYFLSSTDAGGQWTAPARLGDFQSLHSDVVAMDNGRVAIAWDAVRTDGQSVFVMQSTDSGKTWSAPRQISEEGANATHPRLVATENGFRIFWTQTRTGSTATLNMRKL